MPSTLYPRRRVLKTLLLLCWLTLLAILVQRDILVPELDPRDFAILTKAKEEQFYGIWFNNKRIGYVTERYRRLDTEKIQLHQFAHLQLKIIDSVQSIDMQLTGQLAADFTLHNFNFLFDSPFYHMEAQGDVKGNTIHFTLDTGREYITDSVTVDKPPMLPLNHRYYLLQQLPKPGDKVKISFFDPLSLGSRESITQYKGKEKIFINNRVHNLFHFVDSHSGVQVNYWLNEKGKTIKQVSQAGFVFIAEPEFKAKNLSPSETELLSNAAVAYTGTLPPDDSKQVRYRLTLPQGGDFDLTGGRQQYHAGVLTISREQPGILTQTQGQAQCDPTEALDASRYVQADHPDIIRQAATIAPSATPAFKQVQLLAQWVYEHLDKRPVIGLPDALATLHSRKGDCNEHAALFAALARANEIPTTIATGVTLHKNAFYYHAWNEVCVDGQWISLDTTTNQLPADLYHIRFINGDLTEQLRIGSLIGTLQLEILKNQESVSK